MKHIRFIVVLMMLLGILCSSIGFALAGPSGIRAQTSVSGFDSSDWGYWQQITVKGSPDGALTDYQVMLTVYKDSGGSSGGSIYLDGHCNDDFSDIRFISADGTKLFDYWIESYDSSSAVIWVELDSIPEGPGTVDFYIYYDNPSATSASNGSNTFIFFDDFSGIVLDSSKWITRFKDGGGIISVSGGVCTIQCRSSVWSSANLYSDSQFGTDTRLRAYVKSDEASNNHDLGFRPLSYSLMEFDDLVRIENIRGGTNQFNGQVCQDGVQFDGLMGEADTDWHIYEIRRGSTEAEFFVDEDHAILDVSPSMYMAVWARAEAGVSPGVRTLRIDWVAVGNYTQHEPTFICAKSNVVWIGLLGFGAVLTLLGMIMLVKGRARNLVGGALAAAKHIPAWKKGLIIFIVGTIFIITAVVLIVV